MIDQLNCGDDFEVAHTAFEFEVRELSENISGLKIELSNTEYTYSGLPICPAVSVTDGKTILNADSDYTVEYLDNINAGIGVVQVKGIGKYEGELISLLDFNLIYTFCL